MSASGHLLGTASTPTTVDGSGGLGGDVLDGVERCLAGLGVGLAEPGTSTLLCSSAGGGLRLAVVGYERVVTAEAGYRAGLSAGAKVVHVAAGALDGAAVRALLDARPDVVLLVGGTDGGNAEVLLHNARRLASSRLRAPVVVAGNADASDEAAASLTARRKDVTVTANVLPEIGVLRPEPARAAVRELFLTSVIGGKGLSRRPDFARLVRAATPDAVLAGVECLGRHVVVVDVGGATTDVYSVVPPHPGAVAGETEAMRSVEGDLGMRWSAPGVVAAAVRERLLPDDEAEVLARAAAERAAVPALLAGTDAERATDLRLAELAVTVALRRHGRDLGRALAEATLVVGSGGVLRHTDDDGRRRVLRPAVGDHGGGWAVPVDARVAVDADYVLAAAGLLAEAGERAAARTLAGTLLDRTL